jgi:hypothetical protein
MGDAGEGLVDAEDRFQQWVAEREHEQHKRRGGVTIDPERARKLTSLQLARAELQRQQTVTQNAIRREQIRQALADLDKRLAEV